MVSPSKQFIDLLNSIKQNFMWNGVVLKSSILLQSEGTLREDKKQSQLEALKTIWIIRLVDDNFHAWKPIPNAFFLDLGVNAVFHGNFKRLPILNPMSQ